MRGPDRPPFPGEDDGPNVPGRPGLPPTATTSGCHGLALRAGRHAPHVRGRRRGMGRRGRFAAGRVRCRPCPERGFREARDAAGGRFRGAPQNHLCGDRDSARHPLRPRPGRGGETLEGGKVSPPGRPAGGAGTLEAVRMSGRRNDRRGKAKAEGKAKPPPAATGRPAHEDVEARLARRIAAWARTWTKCPLNACQRAGACRRAGDCRAIDRTEPVGPFSEHHRRILRAALRAESARRAAPARG